MNVNEMDPDKLSALIAQKEAREEEGQSEPDRRVLAMQQFVKAEAAWQRALREAEQAQKRAAVAQERLDKYRQELYGALGEDSPNVPARTRLSGGSEW